MKIMIARGPGRYGGIYRRFSELARYCRDRHTALGIEPLADSDEPEDTPIRTFRYARANVKPGIMSAETIPEVVEACEELIDRLAGDLRRESPDKLLAVDTDLKGLIVIAAAHRAELPVTTFIAGLSTIEAEFGGRPAPRFIPAVERFCLEQSDHLIFPSRIGAEHCAARFSRMAPYSVIHNGIADEFLNAPSPSPAPDRVGAVMRLSSVKNPEMLGDVAIQLRDRGVGTDLITGGGRPRILNRLSAVRLLPQTHRTTELAEFYGHCRAILSPSHFEVSGNVPMEAMACGTPAVITEGMGIRELFDDLDLGHLVVKVGDVRGAVDRLMMAEPIAPAVREKLRTDFAWPAVCGRIIESI